MEAIYKQHGDAVDVVAVNTGFLDPPEKIATYRKQLDLAVPVAIEPEGWLAKKLGVPRVEGVGPYKVPYSVVINRNGEVTYLAYDNQGVDAAIDAALK